MIQFRDAKEEDLDAMLAIHNHYVLTSNAMPQREPRSFNEQAAWFAAVQRRSFPILVVDNAGDIIGYAYVDRFAELKSFEPSIEGHIYLKPGSTGNRLGAALLRVLVKRASRLHKRSLIVRIDSTNIASIKIHKRCGFTFAGELRDVGFKNGKFVSSTYMQLLFDGPFQFD